MLNDRIEKDYIKSMKEKNKVKIDSLRLIRAALHNLAIEKKEKKLTDDEVIKALKTMKKQRKESIEAFTKGNRADLAKKEKEELEIINTYLPEELSEEEIIKLVKKAITDTGAQGRKDMGKVMQALMAEGKGRIDGKVASRLVSQELEKQAK